MTNTQPKMTKISIDLTEDEVKILKVAANVVKRSNRSFALFYTLDAAKRIVQDLYAANLQAQQEYYQEEPPNPPVEVVDIPDQQSKVPDANDVLEELDVPSMDAEQ